MSVTNPRIYVIALNAAGMEALTVFCDRCSMHRNDAEVSMFRQRIDPWAFL
jgi:hypothetical protein